MTTLFAFQGAYTCDRAAALAGVPTSTVYYWARNGVLVPSVSPVREKLWSYADLMALRIIYWLRQKKGLKDHEVPGTPMPQIRKALESLDRKGMQIWDGASSQSGKTPILVDLTGKIHLALDKGYADLKGQRLLGEKFLDLLGPFETDKLRGPNLIHPRPHLRIIPGKVSGQPHIDNSRVSTLAIAALAERGFDAETIKRFYPEQTSVAIAESIDLENQLQANSTVAA